MTVDDHAELISFKGFGKTFATKAGDLRAATDIDLAIRQGEFVTLVGPSGCGKSTLLNAAAGLFEIKGMGRREIADRVSELVTLVGLKGFEKSYPTQLSGGMRKRAALARLLAYDPDTLLMDEPFGALDAQLRLGLQIQLRRLCQRLNKTVLFVTHDLDEAIALADRAVVFTRRPGTVKRILTVDLPRDRNLMQLRHDRRYMELTAELWDLLAPSIAEIEALVEAA